MDLANTWPVTRSWPRPCWRRVCVYGNDHRGNDGLTGKPSDSLGDFGPVDLISSSTTWFLLGSSQRTNTRDSCTFCWGSSLGLFAAQQFVLYHGHSIDGRCCTQVLAHSMAWLALLNRCLQERIR